MAESTNNILETALKITGLDSVGAELQKLGASGQAALGQIDVAAVKASAALGTIGNVASVQAGKMTALGVAARTVTTGYAGVAEKSAAASAAVKTGFASMVAAQGAFSTSLGNVGKGLGEANDGMRSLVPAVAGAVGAWTNFSGATRAASLEAGGFELNSRSLRTGLSVLRPIAQSAGTSIASLGGFARAGRAGIIGIAAAAGGALVVALEAAGDKSRLLRDNLSATFNNPERGGKLFQSISDAAKTAGVSIDKVSGNTQQLIQALQQIQKERGIRLAPGAEGFGLSDKEATQAQGIMQKLVATTGASGAEAQKIIASLQSDMTKISAETGKFVGLTGDRFRQLQLESPKLANALAQALRPGLKDISQFASLLDRQPLSLDKFVNGLLKAGPAAEAAFDGYKKTFPQALENVGAAWERLSGTLSKTIPLQIAGSAADKFSKSLDGIGESIQSGTLGNAGKLLRDSFGTIKETLGGASGSLDNFAKSSGIAELPLFRLLGLAKDFITGFGQVKEAPKDAAPVIVDANKRIGQSFVELSNETNQSRPALQNALNRIADIKRAAGEGKDGFSSLGNAAKKVKEDFSALDTQAAAAGLSTGKLRDSIKNVGGGSGESGISKQLADSAKRIDELVAKQKLLDLGKVRLDEQGKSAEGLTKKLEPVKSGFDGVTKAIDAIPPLEVKSNIPEVAKDAEAPLSALETIIKRLKDLWGGISLTSPAGAAGGGAGGDSAEAQAASLTLPYEIAFQRIGEGWNTLTAQTLSTVQQMVSQINSTLANLSAEAGFRGMADEAEAAAQRATAALGAIGRGISFETLSAAFQAATESINASLTQLADNNAPAILASEFETAASRIEIAFSNMGQAVQNILAQVAQQAAAVAKQIAAMAQAAASIQLPGGGGIEGRATGGLFRGLPGVDQNIVALSDYEYVINPQATKRWLGVLSAINRGDDPFRHIMSRMHGYNLGGLVTGMSSALAPGRIPAFAEGGLNRTSVAISGSAIRVTVEDRTSGGVKAAVHEVGRAAVLDQVGSTGPQPGWRR